MIYALLNQIVQMEEEEAVLIDMILLRENKIIMIQEIKTPMLLLILMEKTRMKKLLHKEICP